jgi:putative membrane protein
VDDLSSGPPLSVIAGLIALQAAYLLCAGPFRNRFRDAAPVGMGRQLLFAQGVVVLLIALASPLHELSDRYLFTAHMIQHLMLTLVAAPLMLAGTPGWMLREVLEATRLTRAAVVLRHPLLAFGAFNLVFAIAHVPTLYELALSHELLHASEHLLFLVTALIMWLPVLSPLPAVLPRYPALGQVLYLFFQTVPSSLVGALLSGTSSAFYPTYVLAPRIVGLSPLEDQQLGGLLMWVGCGTYFLLATAIVFFAWASREEAANRRPVGALRASER